jgi:signal transduction histidine kinase
MMNGIWPAAMASASADTQQKRFAILQQTLIARSRPGVRFYPGAALLYIPFVAHEPVGLVAASSATALLVLLAVARRLFYRDTARRTWAPERWRTTFLVLSSLSILIFDSLMAFEAYRRSLDLNCIALIACSIAIRASSTYTTCPDLRIHDSFARWTRIPVFVTLVAIGTSLSFFLFALLATHMLYLHKQSRQLNAEFWEAIHEREERARIEIELRLAQKLESVGRLAAGIAHEINTPLQAMMGNLEFMREGVDELIAMANPTPEQVADLQYLKDNLPGSLLVTQECVERTAAIVRSVKKFAHPEAEKTTSLDINAAVQSTLDISRHEYAMVADTKTDFGDLPPVDCYAGELNQALLNIVVNAAHAIGDVFARTGTRGTICVRTRAADGYARIEIEDTGGGIPETIRDRIFDPFFTTKEVGKGTGQGLALARSVAIRHGGELTFDTEIGRGTTFVIRLPITNATRAAA